MIDRWPQPEIEELSEPAWQRVERAVFDQVATGDVASIAPARPRPSRDRIAWIGGGAIVAAAAVALLVLGTGGEEPSTENLASRVVTEESPTTLTLAASSIRVAPQSAVQLRSSSDEAVIHLERGSVHCQVSKRKPGERFVVEAGDVQVHVVGTEFSVSREEQVTVVEVDEGTVEVVANGKRARVTAGETWQSEPVVAKADAGADERAEAARERRARRRAARRAKRLAERRRRADEKRTLREEANGMELEVAPEVAPEVEPEDEPPVLSDKERYRQAARLEASDPAAASAIYQQLTRSGGRWAATALFAQARLDLERGRAASGRRLLRRYLRRYPKGANAEDAQDLLDSGGL